MWRTGLQERGLVLWTSTGLREQKEKIGTGAKHWAQLRLSALESTEQPGLWKPFSKVFKEMRIQMNSVFGPSSMREVTSLTLPFRIPCCFTIERPYLIPHNNTWETTIEGFFFSCVFCSVMTIKERPRPDESLACAEGVWSITATKLHWEQGRLACPSLKPHIHILGLIIMSVLIMLYSKNHAECAIPRGSEARWEPVKWCSWKEVKRLPLPSLALQCKAE